mgnify:FL=1
MVKGCKLLYQAHKILLLSSTTGSWVVSEVYTGGYIGVRYLQYYQLLTWYYSTNHLVKNVSLAEVVAKYAIDMIKQFRVKLGHRKRASNSLWNILDLLELSFLSMHLNILFIRKRMHYCTTVASTKPAPVYSKSRSSFTILDPKVPFNYNHYSDMFTVNINKLYHRMTELYQQIQKTIDVDKMSTQISEDTVILLKQLHGQGQGQGQGHPVGSNTPQSRQQYLDSSVENSMLAAVIYKNMERKLSPFAQALFMMTKMRYLTEYSFYSLVALRPRPSIHVAGNSNAMKTTMSGHIRDSLLLHKTRIPNNTSTVHNTIKNDVNHCAKRAASAGGIVIPRNTVELH